MSRKERSEVVYKYVPGTVVWRIARGEILKSFIKLVGKVGMIDIR
jgi:hypothetical protein